MMISEAAPPTETDTGSVPATEPASQAPAGPEVGGREGLDPTRYGDWEKNGRCIDF